MCGEKYLTGTRTREVSRTPVTAFILSQRFFQEFPDEAAGFFMSEMDTYGIPTMSYLGVTHLFLGGLTHIEKAAAVKCLDVGMSYDICVACPGDASPTKGDTAILDILFKATKVHHTHVYSPAIRDALMLRNNTVLSNSGFGVVVVNSNAARDPTADLCLTSAAIAKKPIVLVDLALYNNEKLQYILLSEDGDRLLIDDDLSSVLYTAVSLYRSSQHV